MKKTWDVAAVAGSRFVRQAVLVLVMAIAARVLGKEPLGVWALIYVVIQFGVLLGDSGISIFVVRHRELDSRMFATAFYLSSCLALLVATIVALTAVPLAATLGYREFAWHFIASALAIIPLTMNGMLQAKLRRDRRFNMMMFSDVIANGVLLVGAITMLYSGFHLWSFIVPTIAAAFVGFMLCSLATGLPRLEWARADAKVIVNYSLGLVGFSSINFWARNIDHVLIGRFLGAAPLGIYSFAYRIMMLPLSQVNATAVIVALPYLTPHQDNPKQLCVSMRALITTVGMLTTLPMCWIWLERDFMIQLFLGDGWNGVADLLLVLAPLAVLQTLVNPIGLCYQVTGETRKFFVIGVINTLVTVASFVVGVWLGTLEWVVICYAIANVIMVPINVGTGLGTIGGRVRDWMSWCAPFFACLALCWGTYQWLPRVESQWIQAAITLISTSLVSVPAYFFAYRRTFGKQFIANYQNAELTAVQSS